MCVCACVFVIVRVCSDCMCVLLCVCVWLVACVGVLVCIGVCEFACVLQNLVACVFICDCDIT